MRVRYESIDGELVSALWYTFLTEARKDGVRFVINEGHRTLARQAYFYNCYRCGCCNNGNLAAVPSPWAPHIRTGSPDHANDTDELDALIEYGRKNGVSIAKTVAGEAWHGEAIRADLQRFHDKHKTPPILSDREAKLVARFQYHVTQMKREAEGGKGPKYLTHRRWMRWHRGKIVARARLLYRQGKGNFKKHNRGKRRALLLKIAKEA